MNRWAPDQPFETALPGNSTWCRGAGAAGYRCGVTLCAQDSLDEDPGYFRHGGDDDGFQGPATEQHGDSLPQQGRSPLPPLRFHSRRTCVQLVCCCGLTKLAIRKRLGADFRSATRPGACSRRPTLRSAAAQERVCRRRAATGSRRVRSRRGSGRPKLAPPFGDTGRQAPPSDGRPCPAALLVRTRPTRWHTDLTTVGA